MKIEYQHSPGIENRKMTCRFVPCWIGSKVCQDCEHNIKTTIHYSMHFIDFIDCRKYDDKKYVSDWKTRE